MWKKPVAGGPVTHGEVIKQIYEKFPWLLRKNKCKARRKSWKKKQAFFEKAVICNEFGGSILKHSHAHMYCQTAKKYTFRKFKRLFIKMFGFRISDIRRPVNFRECIRYVTKEDRKAVCLNIPVKFTSTLYWAYRYFLECSQSGVIYGDYVPSTVAPCDRKVFESAVSVEKKLEDARYIHDRVMHMELLPWQEELVQEIRNVRGSDRAVTWIVDTPGGAGKSLMCQWLLSQGVFGKGILFQDLDYRTNSFLYNSEGLVMFDIPRTTTPTDLRFVEDVKNGYLIFTKYECSKKIFPSPVVIVFANDYPVKTLLSLDRWNVFHIGTDMDNGRRIGTLIRHPEFNV